MAQVVCLCALVLLATAGNASNIVSGLYCQDPDTGKLYPLNTTWPSQTFCGNYTCKLRKKNITETEYAPIPKIDITNMHIPKEDKYIVDDMAITSSDISIVTTQKTDKDFQSILHKEFSKKNNALESIKDLNVGDGYLTETEIKTITDMLHTVKKSDLEAIVDIYNLAQDIYKEIDSVSDETKVTESKDVKIEQIKDQQSYWYDPAQYQNKLLDVSREKTNKLSTKTPLSDSRPTLFNGPLSNKDFGKIPYYYPMSNFQRLSSYVHHKPIVNDLEKSPTETKPCTKAPNNHDSNASPGHNLPMTKPQMVQTMKPGTLLPYPFSYIYHYNVSSYPPNYYYNYPLAHPEYNRHRNYPQPYYGAYITQIPNITPNDKSFIPQKRKRSEADNSEEKELFRYKKIDTRIFSEDWKTRPLYEYVVDEARPHLEKPKALKPIPSKKKERVERVGKLIKLDELAREKRDVDGNDTENNFNETSGQELEAYVEKIICENSTEPGYFSIGNMSQPYPACCPQKLDSLHTTIST